MFSASVTQGLSPQPPEEDRGTAASKTPGGRFGAPDRDRTDLVAGFGTVLGSVVATALPNAEESDDPTAEVDAFVEEVLLALIAEFARLEASPDEEED